ncbi:MAG: hypothetical protein GY778_32115 [bacterium]|nr:hypothetical protein [bacterium]
MIAFVALLVLVGIPLAVLDVVGRSALQRQVDAIRAAGQPVTWDELNALRPVLADEDNGALLVVSNAVPFEALSKEHKSDPALPLIGRGQLPVLAEPYAPETLAAIETLLADAREQGLLGPLDRLRLPMPGRLSIEYKGWQTTLPSLSAFRTAAKVKALEALTAARAGEIDRSAMESVVILHIAGTLQDEPNLICALVATACDAMAVDVLARVLAVGSCRDATLQQVGKALDQARQSRSVAIAMQGERLASVDLIGSPGAFAVFGGSTPPKALGWLRGWVYLEQAQGLSLLTPLAEPGLSTIQVINAASSYQKQVRSLPRYYILTRTVLPSLSSAVQMHGRRLADLDCAHAGLAVERYRLQHDRWPDSLSALVPEFLEQGPIDPFDEQPLRFIRTSDGVTVYSIGPDGVDDGGDVTADPKTKPQAPDDGFRLIDPDRRGFHLTETEGN